MSGKIGLMMAVLFLAGGALWLKFGEPQSPAVTQPPPVVSPGTVQTSEKTGGKTSPPQSPEQQVRARAAEILPLLKAGDLGALAAYVHPTKGLRFSPYVHSDPADRVYQANQLAGAMADPTIQTWGISDGSGLPLKLTFQQYWQRFVWPRDFTQATQVAVDTRLGQGTVRDNTAEVFSGAHWVEYHLPNTGDTLNWASLRLVFEQQSGQWYLVGIVLDHWTI